MNKKGFVLMETIVVIVVVSVALLTIFSSYYKILSKIKSENKYDTSEYIYITKYIKEYLLVNNNNISLETSGDDINISSTITDYSEKIKNNGIDLKKTFGVKKIYLITNLNKFSGNEKKFDAYMIDYIKKLDVRDNDRLLIVEYERLAVNPDNSPKRDSNNNELYETYISSLEWDYETE